MNTPAATQRDAKRHDSASRNEANIGTQFTDEPTLTDIASDIRQSLSRYATKRPEVVALWSFGIGFVLAWKLKPW